MPDVPEEGVAVDDFSVTRVGGEGKPWYWLCHLFRDDGRPCRRNGREEDAGKAKAAAEAHKTKDH